MITKLKVILEQFCRLLVRRSSSEPMTVASVFTGTTNLEAHCEKPLSDENNPMLDTPDLLSSIEKIISDDFCVLKTSDTLADAFALVTLQKASDIIIVDNHDKFAGILRDISVINQLPPQVSDVPLEHQIKIPKIRQQVSNSTVTMIKQPINYVFTLTKNSRTFSKNEYLLYALQELAKPQRTYLTPQIVPILNKDETIAGVVSCKSVLEYIKNHRFWIETKAEELLTKTPRRELYTLLPEDPLFKASFAMEYLPIDYIVICEQQNQFLGIVDRKQVNSFKHPLYYHLMEMRVSEIMNPVNNLSLFKESATLNKVVSEFLNLEREVAIVVATSVNQVQPLQVITPFNLLQIFIQNFRSLKN